MPVEDGGQSQNRGTGWGVDPPSAVPCRKLAAPGNMPIAPLPPTKTHCDPRQALMMAATSPAVHSSGRHTNARPRLSLEEALPLDVLEAVLGFLERETLCTARLVSKTFCAAASAHICSLTLPSTSQAVSRHRFPRLGRVTISHDGKQDSSAHVDPSLQGLIAKLIIKDLGASLRETLSQLALMTKLRELDLRELGVHDYWDDVGHDAALLHQCTNLEIIRVIPYDCSLSVATTIATLTSLTELHIAVHGPGSVADYSWLHATALRNVQALDIFSFSEALPLIGNLTGLTGLSWLCHGSWAAMGEEVPYSLAPLTRLTKLRSLSLWDEMSENNVEIACSLNLCSLTIIDMSDTDDSGIECGRFLTHQTALTQLALGGAVGALRHIGPIRIDLLQDLSLQLQHFTCMDAVGLSALGNASSLTRLDMSMPLGDGPVQLPALHLSQALSGLTRLRHLVLDPYGGRHPAKFLDYALALRPLTSLTWLQIASGNLDNGDLRALLVLTRLRVLTLSNCCLTDDVVPELGVLTNLTALDLNRCGVTSLAPATNVVNAVRHARGWPPMEANIWEM